MDFMTGIDWSLPTVPTPILPIPISRPCPSLGPVFAPITHRGFITPPGRKVGIDEAVQGLVRGV